MTEAPSIRHTVSSPPLPDRLPLADALAAVRAALDEFERGASQAVPVELDALMHYDAADTVVRDGTGRVARTIGRYTLTVRLEGMGRQ